MPGSAPWKILTRYRMDSLCLSLRSGGASHSKIDWLFVAKKILH